MFQAVHSTRTIREPSAPRKSPGRPLHSSGLFCVRPIIQTMAIPNLNAPVETDDEVAVERVTQAIGRSGLRHWAGYNSEEFLTELRGNRGYKILDEMRRNEPAVVGLLGSLEGIIGSVAWVTVPVDDENGADLAAAAHVNKAMHKMRRPWDHAVQDSTTMFPFGWAFLETTYKYAEGKVWWDAMDLRGQDTLYRWGYDDQSHAISLIQRPAPTYEEIEIPLNRGLLFRTNTEKDNPEGIPILRGAYKPYFYKKVIEEVEAMGAERDLLGIPVMEAPFGATEAEIQAAQSIVENIKNDDQAGVVTVAIGPEAWQRFNLKLLTGQGSGGKVSYTDRLITRYTAEIGFVAQASFLHMGMSKQGYRLDSDVRDLYQMAVKNWIQKICDTFQQGIDRLLAMNGMSGKCKLTFGRITQLNLQTITNFITSGVQNKFITPNRELEQFLRQEAELPLLATSAKATSEAEPEPNPVQQLPASLQGKDNSGLNANPGDNQQGSFAPNAASGGLTKTLPGEKSTPGNPASPPTVKVPPKAASEELRLMLSELDDTDAWEEFSLKAITAMSGEFWED